MRKFPVYIHERNEWPEFTWERETVLLWVSPLRLKQGRLLGKMAALGFPMKQEAILETLTSDVIKSSEIEGDVLHPAVVRSSVARRLGLDMKNLVKPDKRTDGVVEMMLDATQHFEKPLTKDRLFKWHKLLFPKGTSDSYTILVGKWRDGPMQVVSGAMGKEKVHFEAPDSKKMEKEMTRFLKWFNVNDKTDPVIKAALAHLWFLTIHPFDDGNGRIARAITDMQLARAEDSSQRFYSMSAQIMDQRKGYYDVLEKTQKGNLEINKWMNWFLDCLDTAVDKSAEMLATVLLKARFWDNHKSTTLNERQRKMINKLFDHFDGKLTTTKWAKMTKSSQDTALRDIQDLLDKKILVKDNAGGRSTGYEMNWKKLKKDMSTKI
jgi:Fic family protein